MIFVHDKSGIHMTHSHVSNAVSSGFAVPGYQSVIAEEPELSIDARALSSALHRIWCGILNTKQSSYFFGLEPMYMVFTPDDSGKELPVEFTQGIEGTRTPVGFHHWFTDTSDFPVDVSRIIDRRQCVEICPVGSQTEAGVVEHIGDTLSQRLIITGFFAVSDPESAEFLGTVDDRLDTQYNPVLVVHFDPVTPHTVLDPRYRRTTLRIGDDRPGERAMKLPTHETHDVVGLKADSSKLLPFYIERVQPGAIATNDVGGIFSLIHDPVIFHSNQDCFQKRVDPAGECVHDFFPPQGGKSVRQFLRFCEIGDMDKSIVALFERYVSGCHLASKPFVAIDIDLDGEGQPGTQTYMHEPEMPVKVIQVKRQDARGVFDEHGASFTVSEAEGVVFFVACKDADQPFGYFVTSGDVPHIIFLTDIISKVDIGTSGVFGELFNVFFDNGTMGLCECREILKENVPSCQKNLGCGRVGNRKVSLKDYSVKHRYNSCKAVRIFLKKFVHGVLLPNGCLLTSISDCERRYFMLFPYRALREREAAPPKRRE
jgi:hypothetical protein